jgi:hypothetical protein
MHEDGGIVSEVPFDEESSGAVLVPKVLEDLEMNQIMEEARLKSLNRLEQSGVDLPVSAIETVLDREITPADYYGGRRCRRSLPCGSNANVQPFVDADNHERNDIDPQLQDTTDVEKQEKKVRIPWFAPSGSTKRVGVTIVQSDDDALEMQPADQSRFALANKSSHAAFLFPKDKVRRIKCGLALCCILHLALVALIVAVATNRNDRESQQFASSVESGNEESDESSTPAFEAEDESSTPAFEVEDESSTPTCEDEVSIDGRCFVAGSGIAVRFQNCLPLSDDWLGVYDSQDNSRELGGGDLVSWMWTCGDQECEGEVSSSVLEFSDVLEPGNYKVHLIRRNSGGPYSAYASSAEFQVTKSARDCKT